MTEILSANDTSASFSIAGKTRQIVSVSAFSLLFLLPSMVHAQYPILEKDHSLLKLRIPAQSGSEDFLHSEAVEEQNGEREEFPEPNSVLYRSMIIPGWGQITNRQIWKVPIIYGIFAGVGVYNYMLSRQYRGYRAAYYNTVMGDETDYRFGQTPDFIPAGLSGDQLRDTRDSFRNQRDFSYVVMVLAYGLNILDAYVYAHMRSFDVSDDLSADAVISPGIMGHGSPGVNVRINLYGRSR